MKRLEPGEVLLHIGPHKTGSTTLQLGFHRNREALLDQGVHYAGSQSQPMTAAMIAATGQTLPTMTAAAAESWETLLEEVHGTTAHRTVISSEFFCEADDERASAVVDRLGRDTTQVVITLRPLARILASQWQQYVQNRLTTDYDAWLTTVLADVRSPETPSFWRRHRHDLLVRRWAEAAGADRVTVVVLDESDPLALLRTFESFVAVATGTLDPGDTSANRSLRHAEVELVRRFNLQWRSNGWSENDYTRIVRFGAVRHLQARRPAPGEARVLTPAWAVARAQELSADAVAAVQETGVNVVGDLDSLTDPLPEAATGDNVPVETVPVDVAAAFAAGLTLRVAQLAARPPAADRRLGELESAARAARERTLAPRPRPRPRRGGRRPEEAVSTAGLVQLVARSAVDRVRRPGRRVQ